MNSASTVRVALLISLLTATPCGFAAAAEPQDHPLVSRYPGSTIESRSDKEFDQYKLVIGMDEKGELQGKVISGTVARIVYANPTDRSALEIFTNFEQALKKAGLEVLYTCAEKECGPGFAASRWGRFNGIVAHNPQMRYVAGRLKTEDGEAYIGLTVSPTRTQLDIVEVKEMDAGLVAVDARVLAESIEREGSVSIYGIYFDTGKADLKPESKPSLDQIAALLKNNPDMKIFVVGHTDNVGGFATNMRLSRDRAASVRHALVTGYDIASARLAAHGVGPLAPVAPNTSEEGRGKNRRVELVAQ